jgi:hypothetical protein
MRPLDIAQKLAMISFLPLVYEPMHSNRPPPPPPRSCRDLRAGVGYGLHEVLIPYSFEGQLKV